MILLLPNLKCFSLLCLAAKCMVSPLCVYCVSLWTFFLATLTTLSSWRNSPCSVWSLSAVQDSENIKMGKKHKKYEKEETEILCNCIKVLISVLLRISDNGSKMYVFPEIERSQQEKNHPVMKNLHGQC